MRRRNLLIIIGVLLLALAVVLVVVSLPDDDTTSNTNTEVPTGTTVQNTNTSATNESVRELTEEEKQRAEVTRISGIFAEQYGTYRGGFSEPNVTALTSIVTPAYAKQLESLATSSSGTSEFETTVLSTTIATFSLNDDSVVSVNTLRQETKEDGSESVVAQELALQMVYQNGSWLVASAQWKTPAEADIVE